MKYTVRSLLMADTRGGKVANPEKALQKVVEEYRKKVTDGVFDGSPLRVDSRKINDIFVKDDSVYVVAETLPTPLGKEWAAAIREDILSRPPNTPTGIWVYCGYAFVSFWVIDSDQ